MPISIPNIQPPKRDKTKPSKLKLSELCTWLPKNYFSKIKSDFTPHLEENNIKESITWSQLRYTARESWILDIVEECLKQKLVDRADNFRRRNKKANLKVINSNMQAANNNEEPFTTSSSNSFVTSTSNNNIVTSKNYELYDSTSDMAFDTTFSSNKELSRNISSQPYKYTLKTNTSIIKTTDRISNQTRQKYHINSEDSLPKRIQKKDTLQSSTLANET
ncbi:10460_t:CDS:2 [Cetraspora pellucida]|uniref:10460_t:CDS:1 n=1 Tax=Cetraspora pellucida TaxID=1433469 RepID=A0ACA9NTE5_9GLOM|nr:10460_t:CDS:2 [Cetraspora pellucida]